MATNQTRDTCSEESISYTPGPWHVGGDIRVADDKRIRRNVWGPTPPGMQSGEMVCQLATVDNARLIAAAPELLALLREAETLAVLGDIEETTEAHGWGEWLKSTRAILARVVRS